MKFFTSQFAILSLLLSVATTSLGAPVLNMRGDGAVAVAQPAGGAAQNPSPAPIAPVQNQGAEGQGEGAEGEGENAEGQGQGAGQAGNQGQGKGGQGNDGQGQAGQGAKQGQGQGNGNGNQGQGRGARLRDQGRGRGNGRNQNGRGRVVTVTVTEGGAVPTETPEPSATQSAVEGGVTPPPAEPVNNGGGNGVQTVTVTATVTVADPALCTAVPGENGGAGNADGEDGEGENAEGENAGENAGAGNGAQEGAGQGQGQGQGQTGNANNGQPKANERVPAPPQGQVPAGAANNQGAAQVQAAQPVRRSGFFNFLANKKREPGMQRRRGPARLEV